MVQDVLDTAGPASRRQEAQIGHHPVTVSEVVGVWQDIHVYVYDYVSMLSMSIYDYVYVYELYLYCLGVFI